MYKIVHNPVDANANEDPWDDYQYEDPWDDCDVPDEIDYWSINEFRDVLPTSEPMAAEHI